MSEALRYTLDRKEFVPFRPTFFVCLGTSGAGLSTAIEQIVQIGLAEKPPTQYVTRKLRPNEQRGDQYYPVTDEILSKIPRQISIEGVLYGNRYGFFKPAINKLKKTLITQNVIIDSVNMADDWGQLLPDQKIVSLFFAPQDPKISLKRIIERAQNNRSSINKKDIQARVDGSRESVMNILSYDYWIDTTLFTNVLPALRSVIMHESFSTSDLNEAVILVQNNKNKIQELQANYNTDLSNVVASFFESQI